MDITVLMFGAGFIFLGIYIRKNGEIDPIKKGNIFIISGCCMIASIILKQIL